MKLLIVDDEELTRTGVISSLDWKSLGIDEVLQADDGVHGLEAARLHRPEIILCDVRMPRMDGIEVCRKIRNETACPILFLTARVEEQDRVNGLLSGGDDYITKPFSLRVVSETQ